MSTATHSLVDLAASMLEGHDVPGWPRATAVLLRQALEAAIDDVWRTIEPAMVDTSWRSKTVALVAYIPHDLALETGSLWSALSAACHVHEYDLPPTASELGRLLVETHRVVTELTTSDGAKVREPSASRPGRRAER